MRLLPLFATAASLAQTAADGRGPLAPAGERNALAGLRQKFAEGAGLPRLTAAPWAKAQKVLVGPARPVDHAFHRDFDKHPLKVHVHNDRLPDQVVVLADVHADADRLFNLLHHNGIVRRRQQAAPKNVAARGATPATTCGVVAQAELGSFRWHNPYQWAANDTLLLSLGDRINKGPKNLVTFCFFADLGQQARQAGGRVVLQWGNHETQTAAGYDNSKTRGPGGLLWELWAYGIAAKQFFAADGAWGHSLRQQPIVTQLGDWAVAVHGGICPSKLSLDQELAALQRGLKKDGFAAAELQNENSLTRCRVHRGRLGRVTGGAATEVAYAHDPEHEPRGLQYCEQVAQPRQKPFVYCRTDVGLSRFINYSVGALLRYTREGATFRRQSCNELGSCSELGLDSGNHTVVATPQRRVNPGRGPHRGVARNLTSCPTIAVVPQAKGPLFVLPDVLAALLPMHELLVAAKLVAPTAAAEVPRWTGGEAVLVAPGNLFGAGYHGPETLAYLAALAPQAARAGGQVEALLGAQEVDFAEDPNNDAVWAGGGLATGLLARNLWPEQFAVTANPLYAWLYCRPFGLRIFDLLVLPGGQTSNRRWQDLAADLAEALRQGGYGAELVSGVNSVTKKTGFAGRDGKQGPLLARDAGVTTIVHALDTAMAPIDEIKPYGRKGGTFSLVNVATRLNPSLGGGEGKLLRVQRRENALAYDALDRSGNVARVGKNPFHPKLAV